ncbi:UDP-glucose/GDP-mannose dehydrogenase family protein [Hydrogenovibrio sp. 3SP14C1]|uniref:UDP-glucose dehydrogenase family protein n=1 Tax=Hydrogenovibrio sp. 3SP14C1 TaxID=3038774 RepID=UPI0024179F64|nr:UDP-glucose/GDP-mannose dehydrogenase family protein [Hydrogenovibrio sp. 3SP14C1]MDG4811846.1 UDP-glucose/GDP-mannose dehydrogenase family protein [Hydrogenovibrio sp. 3SP14C1]
MRITVFGCELSGLVTAGSLAHTGNEVIAIPVGMAKAEDLRQGILPRDEPGLNQLIISQVKEGRLTFSHDWSEGIQHGEIYILSMPSWRADKAELVVESIGQSASRDVLIVNQSTFPIGTADRFEAAVKLAFSQRGLVAKVAVASMPEFISEGSAISDFSKPSRVVLGCESEEAIAMIRDLMRPFNHVTDQVKIMSTRAAEYTKYAVNALLATRISLVNELANNAEHFNIDIEEVRQGLGSDSRIGFSYLFPGCGFGGPSFAADVQSLVGTFQSKGYDADLLKAVLQNNETQKEVMFRKAWRFFKNDLKGLKIAIWGLSFKPNTATVDNAPSVKTIEALVAQGAEVIAYDPKANDAFKEYWGHKAGVTLVSEMYEALEQADALMILTEWRRFWSPDYARMFELMKRPVIFDGRNIYEHDVLVHHGFRHFGVGRGEVV